METEFAKNATFKKFKCKECGKTRDIPISCSEWGWSVGDAKLCSYSCMRKYESTHKRIRPRYGKAEKAV